MVGIGNESTHNKRFIALYKLQCKHQWFPGDLCFLSTMSDQLSGRLQSVCIQNTGDLWVYKTPTPKWCTNRNCTWFANGCGMTTPWQSLETWNTTYATVQVCATTILSQPIHKCTGCVSFGKTMQLSKASRGKCLVLFISRRVSFFVFAITFQCDNETVVFHLI